MLGFDPRRILPSRVEIPPDKGKPPMFSTQHSHLCGFLLREVAAADSDGDPPRSWEGRGLKSWQGPLPGGPEASDDASSAEISHPLVQPQVKILFHSGRVFLDRLNKETSQKLGTWKTSAEKDCTQ